MSFLCGTGLLLSFLAVVYSADKYTLKDETIEVKTKPFDENDPNKFMLHYYGNNDYVRAGDNKSPIILHLTYGTDAKTAAMEQKFIFSIAEEAHATLYVAEHRYFGNSIPVQPKITVENVIDIGVKGEAVDDFLKLVDKLRGGDNGRKIIVTGAGYAGQLAILLRQKDANIAGSIVFGAYLHLHEGGGIELGAFDKALTDIYKIEKCQTDKIKKSVKVVTDAKDDLDPIIEILKLSSDPDDGAEKRVIDYVHAALVGLAQENYDRKHSLGEKQTFDPRPLKTYCDKLKNVDDKASPGNLESLKLAIDGYYQSSDVGDDGKHQQLSGQVDIPTTYVKCMIDIPFHCSMDGDNDVFYKECESNTDDTWFKKSLKSYCKRRLGTTFDLTRMAEDTFKSLSGNFTFNGIKNAIYIDGEYDPNKVGGFMNPKDDLQQYKFIVPGATKFAPLLTPVGCDPDNIMQLRYRVIKIVNCWIDGKSDGDCAASNFNKDLPKYEASKGKCEDDLTDQYPWDQQKGATNNIKATTTATQTTGMSPPTINFYTQLISITLCILLLRL